MQRTGENQFLVQTKEIEGSATTPPVGPALPSEREAIEAALSKENGGFLDTQGNPTTQFTEFSSVSAAVSKEIGRNAAIAVLLASVFIMGYITYAFRNVPNSLRYGVSAIVALLHDVLLVVGVFSHPGQVVRRRGEHVLHHGHAHGRRLLRARLDRGVRPHPRERRARAHPQLPGRGEPQPAADDGPLVHDVADA